MRRLGRPRLRDWIISAILIAFLLWPPALPAYIQELNEDEVGEAYRLGQRHDQDTAKFFKDYEAAFANAIPGMHVHHMAVRTPYCAVVVRSFELGGTYPLRRALADSAARADIFQVILWIDGSPSYPLRASDIADFKSRFWGQFEMQLSQERKIAPRKMTAQPLYSQRSQASAINGAQVFVDYDVRDIASALTRIRVTDPDGQTVSAEFDLDKLR